MGYWEVHCEICGASFRIGRIRTAVEPRSHAWDNGGHDAIGTNFVEVDEFSADKCPPESGCKMVFRKDKLRYKYREPRHIHGDEMVKEKMQCWEDEALNLTEHIALDNGCGDYVPENVSDDNQSTYLVDTSSLQDSDDTMADDEEDAASIAESSNHEDYQGFLRTLTLPESIYQQYCPQDLWNVMAVRRGQHHATTMALRAVQALTALNTEPTNERKHDILPEQKDRNDLVKALFKESGDQYLDEIEGVYRETWWWEHIAGPGCAMTNGYSGHRISVEEMQGSNIAQALCMDVDEDDPRLNQDDEQWKQAVDWDVDGITDHMPEGECGFASFYSTNGGRRQVSVVNYVDNLEGEEDKRFAIPFHPTCLEVFKRASLKRHGAYDLNSLGRLWLAHNTHATKLRVPKGEAFKRGTGQWWEHVPGDEWLVANPCFLVNLPRILAESQSLSVPDGALLSTQPRNIFTRVPTEIKDRILENLDVLDVAHAGLAILELHNEGQTLLGKRLPIDMPHLWELWCALPYSEWTGVTEVELAALDQAWQREEERRETVVRILLEEGHGEVAAACDEYWSTGGLDEQREQFMGPAIKEKPAITIDPNATDLIRLVIALDKATEEGKLKGLQNRERIWKDCNFLLDKIEEEMPSENRDESGHDTSEEL